MSVLDEAKIMFLWHLNPKNNMIVIVSWYLIPLCSKKEGHTNKICCSIWDYNWNCKKKQLPSINTAPFSQNTTLFSTALHLGFIYGAIWDFQDDVFLVIIVCSFSWSVAGVKAVFIKKTLILFHLTRGSLRVFWKIWRCHF